VKTEIRVRPHIILPDASVCELWYAWKLIGTVNGADGPGARVVSKYPLKTESVGIVLNTIDVMVKLPDNN
jgi:hypothetical protein